MSAGQYQIGQDILRYVNIMNDLVDVTALHLKEIAEDTGEKLQISTSFGIDQPPVTRDATTQELKDITKRGCQNALAYKVAVIDFMASLDPIELKAALAKFGETVEGITASVTAMADAISIVQPKINTAKDKPELAILSDDIDKAVPKLKLIRRTWCIEK